jgi:hypothetical protein
MDKCSALYAVRELQIKTTVKYLCMIITMVRLKTLTSNAAEDVEQQELPFIAGGNEK